MINQKVREQAARIREAYQSAQPFKHVSIDEFLDVPEAESLLREFPRFDAEHALNEFGVRTGKQIVTDLKSIGPVYSDFYEFIRSPDFLGAMSELTGIPDLLFDDKMYGGGTHENVNGQSLAAHVDFNYDQVNGWHRRLNALLYLNHEWEEDWGGCIELHRNPRTPENDESVKFLPMFNRMVIFETNEYSWHGFRKIRIPPGHDNVSRKCISIYLYTRTRPPEETAPPHGTFYVQPPLPARFTDGYALTDEDMKDLQEAFKVRDTWIEMYQKGELRHSADAQRQKHMIEQSLGNQRLPLEAAVIQRPGTSGIFYDNWLSKSVKASFHVRSVFDTITLRGKFFPGAKFESARVNLDGKAVEASGAVTDGALVLKLGEAVQGDFTLEMEFVPSPPSPEMRDERTLCYHLVGISFA